MGKRTRYTAEFKGCVALDALRGELTLAELSAKHGAYPNLISQWKRLAVENMASVFGGGEASDAKSKDAELEKAHAKIGQLVVERDFLAAASGRLLGNGGKHLSARSIQS